MTSGAENSASFNIRDKEWGGGDSLHFTENCAHDRYIVIVTGPVGSLTGSNVVKHDIYRRNADVVD